MTTVTDVGDGAPQAEGVASRAHLRLGGPLVVTLTRPVSRT